MAAEASAQEAGSAGRTLVYLVRHGQTPLNESGALRGLADPPLDETGRHQAQRLGIVLGPRRLSAVVASPLLRARQTAQPVAERAGLVVSTDQCLLDRDYGPWTGASRESVTSRWGSVDRAPGVEPLSAVRERAVQGLTDIARRCLGGTAVVVSHDAVNRQVLAAFDAGLGDPDAIPQDNGCFNTLEWRDGRWAVLSVGELPAGRQYTNVYLDKIDPEETAAAPGPDTDPQQAAWQTAVAAAPWLVGEPSAEVPPEKLYGKLKPFEERVAADIERDQRSRADDQDGSVTAPRAPAVTGQNPGLGGSATVDRRYCS